MSAVSSPFVAFVGSRSLPASVAGLVQSVVSAVAAAGRSACVGCAVGADAAALVSAVSLGVPVQVFAVGARSGQGFWSGSAFGPVLSASRLPFVRVAWGAGGPVGQPLPVRLLRRSLACVWWAARSGAGCGLVAFVVGGFRSSAGSWRSVRFAVRLGLPVVVFPVGCSVSCFPSFGAGSWVPAAASGVWSSGFRWVAG